MNVVDVLTTSYSAEAFMFTAMWRDEPPADMSARALFSCFGRRVVAELAFASLAVLGIAEAVVRFVVSSGIFACGIFSQYCRALAHDGFQASIESFATGCTSLYVFFWCIVSTGRVVDQSDSYP